MRRRLNKTGKFDGFKVGQLVTWPWDNLIEQRVFGYDDAGNAERDAWQKENTGKYYDSGEGGLEVWAIWPDVWTRRGCCAEGTLHHFAGSVSASPRHEAIGWERHGGYPCIAAILMGSVSTSFTKVGTEGRDESCYWSASEETLTEAGRLIVQSLSSVYGVEPKIVTYLDT